MKDKDLQKGLLYEKAYFEAIREGFTKKDLVMELMTKSGEVYASHSPGRPRMLFVPTFKARVLGGVLTHYLNVKL